MKTRAVLTICAVLFGVAALTPAASCGCDPCAVDEETALDYAQAESWLCRGSDGVCADELDATEVHPDGTYTVVRHSPAADPAADCFYVYPTMDMRLGAGLHTDFEDNSSESNAVRAQGARFAEVCKVYAPLYRQVTLGTYVARAEVREACFEIAFGDVLRAFEHYLAHDNEGRGIVLIGHSQGAQNATALLRAMFDNGVDLYDQLVAGLPIGWPVSVAAGERVGGSFDTIPVCEREDETGCVLAFRSYAEGEKPPAASADYRGGDEVACTNPADIEGNSRALLSRVYLRPDLPYVTAPDSLGVPETPYLLYRNYFRAQCVMEGSDGLLEVSAAPGAGDSRDNPVNFDAAILSGVNGTHVLDMQLAQGDLIDLVGTKILSYQANN